MTIIEEIRRLAFKAVYTRGPQRLDMQERLTAQLRDLPQSRDIDDILIRFHPGIAAPTWVFRGAAEALGRLLPAEPEPEPEVESVPEPTPEEPRRCVCGKSGTDVFWQIDPYASMDGDITYAWLCEDCESQHGWEI